MRADAPERGVPGFFLCPGFQQGALTGPGYRKRHKRTPPFLSVAGLISLRVVTGAKQAPLYPLLLLVQGPDFHRLVLVCILFPMAVYLPTIVEAGLPKFGLCYSSMVSAPDDGLFVTCGPFLVHVASDFSSRICAGGGGIANVARDGELNYGASFLDLVGLCFVGPELYLVDRSEGTIRKIVGTNVTTFCGPTSLNRPCEIRLDLLRPHHIAFVGGKLLVSDTGNHVIRILDSKDPYKIGAARGSQTGLPTPSGVDGSFETCTFYEPVMLTSSNNGQFVYVIESDTTIRQLDFENRSVSTLKPKPSGVASFQQLLGLNWTPISLDNIVSICYDDIKRSISALRSDGVLIVGRHLSGVATSLNPSKFAATLHYWLSSGAETVRTLLGPPARLQTRLVGSSLDVDHLDLSLHLSQRRHQSQSNPSASDWQRFEERNFDVKDDDDPPMVRRESSAQFWLHVLPVLHKDTQFVEEWMRTQAFNLARLMDGCRDVNVRIHFRSKDGVSSFCSGPVSGEWLVSQARQLYRINRSYEATLYFSLPKEISGDILWMESVGTSLFLSTPSCLLMSVPGSSPLQFILFAGSLGKRDRANGSRLNARFNYIHRFTLLNGKLSWPTLMIRTSRAPSTFAFWT